MKSKYHVFAGDDHYPSGGMGDYLGAFDTKEEAEAAIQKASRHYDWDDIAIVDKTGTLKSIEDSNEA